MELGKDISEWPAGDTTPHLAGWTRSASRFSLRKQWSTEYSEIHFNVLSININLKLEIIKKALSLLLSSSREIKSSTDNYSLA